jgi:class 3 adenylate cyclase
LPNLPAGERRQLTVVFCDLVGSTPLSQQLDAEEWRDVLAQHQQTVSRVVARFGGHVARNLGDGLLIYFGWPTAREDNPESAIRAGLAILDAMAKLQFTFEHAVRLAVRIGIHTGPVVIADGGEVFGDTTNVAARVQGAAEPDTVVVTAATQRLVAGIFVMENRGPHALKGVREPITLHRVVQSSGVRSRLDLAAGKLTSFVGRETELATLVDAWERTIDATGQTVLVIGEPGIGKSRLAHELRERLAAEPHTWLECRATPYTTGTAFHPVIELVEQGLLLEPGDTPAEKLAKIERGLGQASLSTGEMLSLLSEFLSLPPQAGYTPLEMSPELKRQRTFEALATWCLRLGERQPVMLLLEDLQWCDPSSLELFGRLIEQSPTARMLVVATARPEFADWWPVRSNVQTLTLGRLMKRQAREMVMRLAGGRPLCDPVVETIVTRADGVPLYVEELTSAMREATSEASERSIPVTLQDLLMARLDRLGGAKEVAQRAAVLGREFSYALLVAVADLGEAAIRDGLARLTRAELLFVRGEPPAATYVFKHALVQEAAYESMLKRTRRELHGRIVKALTERFPERVAAEPEVVARHAEAAGVHTRPWRTTSERGGRCRADRRTRTRSPTISEPSGSSTRYHPAPGEMGPMEP